MNKFERKGEIFANNIWKEPSERTNTVWENNKQDIYRKRYGRTW